MPPGARVNGISTHTVPERSAPSVPDGSARSFERSRSDVPRGRSPTSSAKTRTNESLAARGARFAAITAGSEDFHVPRHSPQPSSATVTACCAAPPGSSTTAGVRPRGSPSTVTSAPLGALTMRSSASVAGAGAPPFADGSADTGASAGAVPDSPRARAMSARTSTRSNATAIAAAEISTSSATMNPPKRDGAGFAFGLGRARSSTRTTPPPPAMIRVCPVSTPGMRSNSRSG